MKIFKQFIYRLFSRLFSRKRYRTHYKTDVFKDRCINHYKVHKNIVDSIFKENKNYRTVKKLFKENNFVGLTRNRTVDEYVKVNNIKWKEYHLKKVKEKKKIGKSHFGDVNRVQFTLIFKTL